MNALPLRKADNDDIHPGDRKSRGTGCGDGTGAVRLGGNARWLLGVVAAFHGRSPEEILTRAIAREAIRIGLPKLAGVRERLGLAKHARAGGDQS